MKPLLTLLGVLLNIESFSKGKQMQKKFTLQIFSHGLITI